MTPKLKILYIPFDAIGHMNACISVAEILRDRGHKIIFAIDKSWRGKLQKYGFEEELFSDPEKAGIEDPTQYWADLLNEIGVMKSLPPIEKVIKIRSRILSNHLNNMKETDLIMENILKRIKPDIIIIDNYIGFPSVIGCGIPWVLSCSFNPLMFIDDERTPPPCSGFPINSSKAEWKIFNKTRDEAFFEIWTKFNSYVMSKGLPSLPKCKFITNSPFLNFYGYPEELDYLDERPLPPNWFRCDSLTRSITEEKFEIPDELKSKPGKMIYFSLGSMGGMDIDLMKRLISILAKSSNRFIVSKGPQHQKFELSSNMWGQKTVPQLAVLPVVDLVITHGGNNTFTESLYFGKPMIVLPLFSDQFDNAQRVHETGYGLRLDPYTCSEEDLLKGIENLINDSELKTKLKIMSERIRKSKSIEKVAEKIEFLTVKNL